MADAQRLGPIPRPYAVTLSVEMVFVFPIRQVAEATLYTEGLNRVGQYYSQCISRIALRSRSCG